MESLVSGNRFAIYILQQCIGFVNSAVTVSGCIWNKCITIKQTSRNCYSDVMAIQIDRVNVSQCHMGIICVWQGNGNGACKFGYVIYICIGCMQ